MLFLYGNGYGGDKYTGKYTGQKVLTLRYDSSGEDDCRCAGGNGDDSCRTGVSNSFSPGATSASQLPSKG